MALSREPNAIAYLDSVCNGINSKGVFRLIRDDVQVFACDALELAWLENEPQVSAIPAGTYRIIPHVSPKFGQCYKVVELDGSEVRGRRHILIHQANYASSYANEFPSELRGCIALGYGYRDLNGDGVEEILNSRRAMSEFRLAMSGLPSCLFEIKRKDTHES